MTTKHLVAIGGSQHGQLIEIGEQFSAKDGVVFAITDLPLPATPPKLGDLPAPPAEAYRIGCIEFEPGQGIEYLIETRLSGQHALKMILDDVEDLALLRKSRGDGFIDACLRMARGR